MKKIYYLGIALAACLSSCSDDSLDNGKTVVNPVQTGDEIIFGSSLSDNTDMESRTVYGDRTDNGVPVYWNEDGSDEIAIYCLQSSQPAKHLVYYNVWPDNSNPAQASAVVKTSEAGLQWGDLNTPHRFYAFYPGSAVHGTSEENETGMITASIPESQPVTGWRIKEANEEGALNGHKTYFGLPNMQNAYMYAYAEVDPKEVDKDQPISLKFKNLVTVLDITVQGPETGEMTVTNINVSAVDGNNLILTGEFNCNIRAASTGEDSNNDGITATCEAAGDMSKVRNTISISCYDQEKNQFITLKPGEYLNVKAYLIPDDNTTIKPQQLKITVATLNGAAKVKTLATADVTPHKINRVLLPPLIESGTNYWLSSLDPDIYLSELSLPGSKMSFASATNNAPANSQFQSQPLGIQFKDGVRAFVIQTRANTTYDRRGNVTDATLNEIYTGESLQNILTSLNNLLVEAKRNEKDNEFAFVQITYDGASYSGTNPQGGTAYKYWIEGVKYVLNSLKSDNSINIYTDEITPSTTLGDVGGSIVLKVNYNEGNAMGQYIESTATIPALFSTWTKGMDDVDLYWGAPQPNSEREAMHWFYSEATHIGNSNEAETLDIKKNQISTVFQTSVDKYVAGTEHNYWFMNDIGGCYLSGSPSITSLTEVLNDYAAQELQKRTQNASLGIVLLNFADKQSTSGALYKSDWLIQTIIDNNFKFALRTRTSSGE